MIERRRLIQLAGAGLLAGCATGAGTASQPAASSVVQLFDPAFRLPRLGRTRAIRVCLPPGYPRAGERLPVFYGMDGQNLFDAATSFAGEWRADETLAALSNAGGPRAILVGIDNAGASREEEYHPVLPGRGTPGRADEFVADLIEAVKPAIDHAFATRPGPGATGVFGASSGATLALHAGFTRPDVFGLIGALSAPLWLSPRPQDDVRRLRPARPASRVFVASGATETVGTLPPGIFARDIPGLQTALLEAGYRPGQIRLQAAPDGQHNEAFWARMLPPMLRFLLN